MSKIKNPQWTAEDERISFSWHKQQEWEEFCSIQGATNLIKNPESIARFNRWLKTRDDDDAWS